MGFYGMLVLMAVAVGLPLMMLKMLLDYKAEKRRQIAEYSVRIDELERLMEHHVKQATRPLEERIKRLEQALEQQGPDAARKAPPENALLDDPSLEG